MPDLWVDVDAALAEVPVNILPLIDDTDFKTIESAVAYNAAGMALKWNFVTTAGAYTQTAVTPTTGGDYDWASQGNGMYSIEIPASGGASINNDTEGFGWFSGVATGVLPWRGPTIGFRAAGLNDKLIDSAYSTTRGLAGTALPDAAAEAAGGLYTRGSGAGQINQQANGQVDVNVERVRNSAINALISGRVDANVQATAASLAFNLTGNITGNLSGSVGSVTGAVGSVTGAVGSVTGNVGGNVLGGVAGSVGSVTAPVTVGTNNDKTGYRLSATGVDDVWDEAVDGAVTARESLRLANSANGAIVAGAATTTVTIRDLADTKDRVTATVDASGNRTAVTRDLT